MKAKIKALEKDLQNQERIVIPELELDKEIEQTDLNVAKEEQPQQSNQKHELQIELLNREVELLNKNLINRQLAKLKTLSEMLKSETENQNSTKILPCRTLTLTVSKIQNEVQ